MSEEIAANQLRSFVERVERLEEEIHALNDDKKEVYAEAKARGFDVPTLKKCIAIRRKDQDALAEEEALLDVYLRALGMRPDFSGTEDATRAGAHVHAREHKTPEAAKPKATPVAAPAQAVTEPEPPKPHILTPSERDPLWEFEHRGMIDAASGQHRVPTDLADDQLAAWQKGHDAKMAKIRERAA